MNDERRWHESPQKRIVVDGYSFTEAELEYAREHFGDWRRLVRRGWLRHSYLLITFVVGILLYFTADGIETGVIGLPQNMRPDLIADFLYNLGVTLWASVILVLFLEIFAREQQRWSKEYLRAMEKALQQLGHEVPDDDPSDDDDLAVRLDALTRSIERLQAEVAALRADNDQRT